MDRGSADRSEPLGVASQHHDEPQILLVLIGLPGSGKTTFAEALVKQSTLPVTGLGEGKNTRRQWIRASQDDAPSRRRQECEARARNGLKQGYNVIIDRVGFDAVQRSHFINIADAHGPRPRVYALYLQVDIASLEARLGLRTSHPTLADPATALRVLADMKRQLSLPRLEDGEGFDRIYTLPESRQPLNGEWIDEDVQSVLRSIEDEGSVETVPRKPVVAQTPARFSTRGTGGDHQFRGGYRGRADFRGRGNGYIPRGGSYRGSRGGTPYGSEGRGPGPYSVPTGSSSSQWRQQNFDNRPNQPMLPPSRMTNLDAQPQA